MTTLGAFAAVGLTVGALASATAGTTTAAVAPAPPAPVRATLTAAEAQTELTALEGQADAAGLAAERADEALLQHRTPATVAAARHAREALESLAVEQQPRLSAVVAVLGTDSAAAAVSPAARITRTHRTRALKAVAFAERQLGKPYAFAGAGLRSYDCSGLTMRAYETVDKSIGGHSATAQYRKARQQHRLHAYAHARPGDLIFYGSPYAVYHVAIYVGHGRMIEAPYPGKAVREVAVRPWGRLAQVARPTA